MKRKKLLVVGFFLFVAVSAGAWAYLSKKNDSVNSGNVKACCPHPH